MKKIFLIITILCICISNVVAESTFSVVPPRNVIAGRNFTVTYRLKDGQGTSFNAPDINGCKKLYGPAQSTMQSYEFVNGRQSSSTTIDYTFTYKALKEGTYTVPAASITVDGKVLKTKSVTFKVLPPDSNSGNGGGGSQGDVDIDDINTQTPDKKISDKDVFIRIILNKSQAYKEEAIECTMKLYTKYQSIEGITSATPPSFDGFLIDEANDQASIGSEIEHYNGQNYLTAVLKKYVIFPQQTGKLTINSGQYDISVVQYERVNVGFFTTSRPVQKTVHVKPGNLSINILPLPQPQPDNFSGAVGNFTVNSNISSTSLRTNEAASLTLNISGSGNIKYIKEPDLGFPEEFEQYTPKVDINANIAGNTVKGTNSIEYTFVPQAVGEFTIPEYEFVYFNPQTKKYETLKTPSYKLNVAKGANTPAASSDQQNITVKNTDILHIKSGDKGLSKDNTPVIYGIGYWLIYILSTLALAAIVIAYSKHIKFTADVTGVKKARANKVAKKRLNVAEKFLKQHNNDAFYEEMLKALWGYISDKLSMPASQLTRQNISEELSKNNIPEDVTKELITVLDDCEMARYTPGLTNENAELTFKNACDIIGKIEDINK